MTNIDYNNDIVVKQDFYSKELVNHVSEKLLEMVELEDIHYDKEGIWKGKLIANKTILSSFECRKTGVMDMLDQSMQMFDDRVYVSEVGYTELHLPWDIHTDTYRKYSYTNSTFYQALIPLEDAPSRTMIFEQRAIDYNDFYIYKERNPVAENPISQEIWDEYLDMCWPHDREYLSLKDVLPEQKVGQWIGFPRTLFHSTDNFHKRTNKPKRFLQVIYDRV